MSMPRLVLGSSTFIAGALLGFVASTLASARSQEPIVAERPQAVASDAAASAMGSEVAPLVAELRELVDVVSANTAALRDGPRREALLADDDALERRLESLLEVLLDKATSQAAPSRRERVLPGEPTRGVRSLARLDLETGSSAHLRAVAHDHLLWSYEEVIEAYGKPDQMNLNDGAVYWSYAIPDTNGSRSYNFRFAEGLVVAVN